MCDFLLFHLCLQLGLYLDSGDESREFLGIKSFVHLHISDNGRKSVLHFQFLSCSCIRDFVSNDC